MYEISFRKIILPLKDKLFRLALQITQNRAEAEDAVQETLIRIWNRRGEWEKIDSLEAYSLTVVRNVAVDHSGRMNARTVELTPDFDKVSEYSGPHDHLVAKDHLEWVRQLVNELPEKQRMTMHLREVEGKSYKEIAALLQISEEQVKVNLFRARQKLRQRFVEIDRYGM